MAGLVSYESSEEDERDVVEPREELQKQNGTKQPEPFLPSEPPEPPSEDPPRVAQPPSEPPQPAPFVGPMPPSDFTTDLPDPTPSPNSRSPEPGFRPPGSPHTSHRALLRELTLPTHPNLDLPPSPPGSPPPALTQKVATFLALKDKGTHFNAKLQSSPALRNPALMDKLLAFAGVGEAAEQYATTVAPGLWDPGAFPRWAFRGELRGAREGLRRERDGERKETGKVEFVASSGGGLAAAGGGPATAVTAGGLSKRRKLE